MLTHWILAAAAVATTTAASAAHQNWQGNQRGLVLLLDWEGTDSTVTKALVEDTFFNLEPEAKSLRSFFLENAQGSFDLTGDVLDWRSVSTRWSSSSGCNLGPIVSAAWRAFEGSFNVADYDSDGDGKIDNLFVVHSGRIGQDRVGPECTFTTYSRANATIVFQAEGLGSIGSAIPIGFYVHEAGHGYFNLPDLYGDHYNGRYGIAMWGMMGLGAWGTRADMPRDRLFRYPASFEPLSKIRIGWATPRVVNRTTRRVTLRPVETSNDIVAVPAGGGSNFYLEYRSNRGWSADHPGHGLLIWKDFALIQADGRDDLNHGIPQGQRPLPPISENFGDASDPFPGSENVTSYQDARAGVRFENIVQTDEQITLDVVVTTEGLHYVDRPDDGYVGPERL